jgi:hypothetical protein
MESEGLTVHKYTVTDIENSPYAAEIKTSQIHKLVVDTLIYM